MESLNIIHGYGKVNPTEEEENYTNKPIQTQNPRITIAITLILLLSIIIGSLIGALIHESTTEPSEFSESIRSVCSVTQHPDSCFTSISSLKADPQNDPQLIFSLSLQLGVNELANLSRSHFSPTDSALRDCDELIGDAMNGLNNSVASMRLGLTEEMTGDLNAWISGAMTDLETCLDGLEEMGSTAVDEVRVKVRISKEYMSNSLAILANIHQLLAKFDLKMH
ncbi:hypothetical protein LguiA_002834 [Lonicera macranthoides]